MKPHSHLLHELGYSTAMTLEPTTHRLSGLRYGPTHGTPGQDTGCPQESASLFGIPIENNSGTTPNRVGVPCQCSRSHA
jgi:hypothetical protein